MALKKENKINLKVNLPAKVSQYLEKAGIKYDILEHKTVYTAFDAATTMKKKMGEIVKSLLVKADKDYFLVLVPADHNLDFKKLAAVLKKVSGKEIKVIKIPAEKVMAEVFKIKKGAISSFGGLHKLPVIIDKNLTKVKKAVFPSGNFNASIELAVKDFMKIENAILGNFGVKRKVVKVKKVSGTARKK